MPRHPAPPGYGEPARNGRCGTPAAARRPILTSTFRAAPRFTPGGCRAAVSAAC